VSVARRDLAKTDEGSRWQGDSDTEIASWV